MISKCVEKTLVHESFSNWKKGKAFLFQSRISMILSKEIVLSPVETLLASSVVNGKSVACAPPFMKSHGQFFFN